MYAITPQQLHILRDFRDECVQGRTPDIIEKVCRNCKLRLPIFCFKDPRHAWCCACIADYPRREALRYAAADDRRNVKRFMRRATKEKAWLLIHNEERNGRLTIPEPWRLRLIQDAHGLCPYCGRSLRPGHIHIDHQIPIVRAHEFPDVLINAYNNLRATCDDCNLEKHDLTDGEYRSMRASGEIPTHYTGRLSFGNHVTSKS